MCSSKTLQLLWAAAQAVRSGRVFNSQRTEKQTHLSVCGEHTALIHVTKMTPQSSLAPSSQIISSFQLFAFGVGNIHPQHTRSAGTKTSTTVFPRSYHGVYYEAASHYLHAVHNVTDGFTLGHLCSQLWEENDDTQ